MKKFGDQDFAQWYFSERNLQILHKKYGKIRAIYFAKTGEKLTFFKRRTFMIILFRKNKKEGYERL